MNCWEFMKCASQVYTECPAYPDKGLDCWKITGTKCDAGRMEKKTAAEKIAYCRTCSFYTTYANKY